MMTPDTRPIGVLTPEILATASHWCLIRTNPRYALVYPTERMHAGYAQVATMDGFWFGSPNDACYPCTLQPNGLVVPEPWPMADGEEIIDALEGIDPNKYEVGLSPATNVWTVYEGRMGWLSCGFRQDMHPAPRKGGKWVWERDR